MDANVLYKELAAQLGDLTYRIAGYQAELQKLSAQQAEVMRAIKQLDEKVGNEAKKAQSSTNGSNSPD